MVFQSYALYPHMTVRENLAFGLRRRRMPRDEIDRRVRERRREARARALPRPQAACALRRPAPAGGARPGHRPRSQGLPVRRAALQPRRGAARHHAQRADQAAARARHDHDLCHPRPGRGHDHGRPHLHHEQGRGRPDRQAAGGLSQARRHLRRPLPRQSADEPAGGAAGAAGVPAPSCRCAGCASRSPAIRPPRSPPMPTGRSPSASGRRTSTRRRRSRAAGRMQAIDGANPGGRAARRRDAADARRRQSRRGDHRPHRPRHGAEAWRGGAALPRHDGHSSLRSGDDEGDRPKPREGTSHESRAASSIATCTSSIPARFPFRRGAGYTPRPDETRHARGAGVPCSTPMASPMPCWSSRAATASTIRRCSMRWRPRPGASRRIAVIEGDESDQELQDLAERGRGRRPLQPRELRPGGARRPPARRACSAASRRSGLVRPGLCRRRAMGGDRPAASAKRRQDPHRSFRHRRSRRGPRRARLPGRARARPQRPRRRQALGAVPHRRPARSLCRARRDMSRRCSRPSATERCVWGSDWPFLGLGRGDPLWRCPGGPRPLASRRRRSRAGAAAQSRPPVRLREVRHDGDSEIASDGRRCGSPSPAPG